MGLIHVRLLDASVYLLSPTIINIPLRVTNTNFGFTSQLQPALSSLLVLVPCIDFLVESHPLVHLTLWLRRKLNAACQSKQGEEPPL